MWQSLLNVQPITRGILEQRRGYNTFAGLSGTVATVTSVTTITVLSGRPIATVVCGSTSGLVVGQSLTISGCSALNGTYTIVAILGVAVFTVAHYSITHVVGTGGIIQVAVSSGFNRLSDFQSDALGTRTIIASGTANVAGYNEDGSLCNTNIFTPVATNEIIRSVTSRNYQYFCDGTNALNPSTHRTGDSLKWDGSASGGVTNNGIVATDLTTNTIVGGGGTGAIEGPFAGTASVDVPFTSPNAWSNPSGLLYNNPVFPTSVNVYQDVNYVPNPSGEGPPGRIITKNATTSDTLNVTGFTASSFPSPIVAGIQMAITYQISGYNYDFLTSSGKLICQLLKNGSAFGDLRTGVLTLDESGTFYTVTVGSPTDLWGTPFVPSELTNGTLGLAVYTTASFTWPQAVPLASPGWFVGISYITATMFGAVGAGDSSSSGGGVGIDNSVGGGAVSLVLGRTYYLVPNNSTTGHFGDLSVPSINTGAAQSAEFNLALATYNDPQVDTKYLLATPDGGDPSILYQVNALVPGFVATSWAIATNVVTFTGAYSGAQFAVGDTYTVGGLSHGSYMNGAVLTITGSSSTTAVAAYTHGNDSSTEFGIVGTQTFAIPNNVFAVVDNVPDPTLVTAQPLLFTDTFGNEYGLTQNTPPPAGTLLLKHQGRLWMSGVSGSTHSIFFSKAVAELTLPNGFIAGKYEEAWPGSNYFDVSDGAESVSALLSDGTTLYIGTQNHVRRLLGSDPTNFQEPQIVHPAVGVLNQESWQIVFMQGSPAGSVWLTPDFKVIQSDFNTYADIGQPIQDILNSLQSTAPALAHAAFVADGELDLYILSVPYKQSTYCDTHLVFDLRARQWVVWQPAGGSTALLYNVTQNAVPQWIFINGAGTLLNIYSDSATTDNGTTIPVTATTTWMHLGEPTRRKLLNDVQVYGNSGMLMSVYGANSLNDFASPQSIIYNRALRQSPFGVWTLYLTGAKSRHRYYQFTFSSTNQQVSLLGSYSISVIPMDDI